MEWSDTRALLVAAACVVAVAVAGALAVGSGGSGPVHAENVTCETGAGVTCEATLVNEDPDTGYNLAVEVVGYDESGDVVTTYTNDATSGGDGIAGVPPGGTEIISISVSSSERVVDGDVRVVDIEATRS